MLKRFFLALALSAGLLSPAFAAGTIAYSLSQQLDQYGKPLAACKLFTYQAGTVATPQSSYQDTALTILWPNPLTCDASGRLPQFFLADGQIKVLLTDSAGVPQVSTDNILVIGPSAGGGGGGSVDATTILATGDLKPRYGTGTLTGFVRANGRTIGSATSGASERANADTQALFIYLYGADANLVVSPGRTGNALNDFNSNMTIALPDWRGRALAFLDDMGNSAAARLTATYFGTAATVLGAAGGSQNTTLTLAQLPTGITVNGTVTVSTAGTENFPTLSGTNWGGPIAFSGGATGQTPIANATLNNRNSLSGTNTLTSNNTSGSAHAIASPMMLATIYIKL